MSLASSFTTKDSPPCLFVSVTLSFVLSTQSIDEPAVEPPIPTLSLNCDRYVVAPRSDHNPDSPEASRLMQYLVRLVIELWSQYL